MYGEDGICHFRHGYVGVILYPHSQAKHFIGNGTSDRDIYFCLHLNKPF